MYFYEILKSQIKSQNFKKIAPNYSNYLLIFYSNYLNAKFDTHFSSTPNILWNVESSLTFASPVIITWYPFNSG